MSTVPAFSFALLPAESGRSNPIPFTMERIKGYPKKLVIYRIQASSYWWVRHYADGRYYKRSCGTDVRRDANGDFIYHHVLKGEERNGERRRSVKITHDLRDMIVFMVNSYIRPTDLKNMQHKHVDVVSNEWHYLRLNLPPSKGHKFPITTMPWAVRVYERIVKRNTKKKLAGPEDYVFMPEYGEKSRGHALKMLQYQFDALLDLLDMKNSPQGEPRTIYSLRHSSIMFRLLYGASIDTLKLARNARTSPEMIDRFYAAPSMGEMAIAELQAKRRPRPWER